MLCFSWHSFFAETNTRRDLKHTIKHPPDGFDPSGIPSQRQSLADEILSWRKTQMRALPQLGTLLSTVDPNVNAEDDILFLPSDIDKSAHASLQITALASIEYHFSFSQIPTPKPLKKTSQNWPTRTHLPRMLLQRETLAMVQNLIAGYGLLAV